MERCLISSVRCGFNKVDSFRAFCAVGDIDPDQLCAWEEYQREEYPRPFNPTFIWLSRSKDVVFEASCNPLKQGICHYFGLTGVADKAIAMYNFMHDNYNDCGEDDEIATFWTEMSWGREYC
jgi:hypothetical protein